MSILKNIQTFIEAKHVNGVVSLVQFTKSQSKGDTMHFYVFVNSRIEYLITTYKKESINRMQLENEIMTGLLKGVTDAGFLNSILFSYDLLTLGNHCFRVQKYIDFQDIRKKNQKITIALCEKYLNQSFGWIGKFQTLRGHQTYHVNVLRDEMSDMVETLPANHCLIEVLNQLKAALDQETWHLTKGLSHGDFCYYNYLLQPDDQFQVFDWEHATDSYWLVFDPILNFETLWIHFFNNRKVKNIYQVLCLNRVETEGEKKLVLHSRKIMQQYGLSQRQFVIMMVFVFYRAIMREGKYVVPPCDPKFMNLPGILSWVQQQGA
jgi:hypothetical protein